MKKKEEVTVKEHKRSQYWDAMVFLLDKHFPKGKSKERGQAMVMLAYIDLLLTGYDVLDNMKKK